MFSTTSGAGQKLSRRYSQCMDELLRRLFQNALETCRRDGPLPAVQFAAVGGYGRELLGWKSDLDVRFLTRAEPERLQGLAEAMLYPLWDAGISIGHQVITPSQVVADAVRDLPTATALLDFRTIAGIAHSMRACENGRSAKCSKPRACRTSSHVFVPKPVGVISACTTRCTCSSRT